MEMIINYLPLFGVLALGFVFWKNAWVTKQDEGNDKMKRIQNYKHYKINESKGKKFHGTPRAPNFALRAARPRNAKRKAGRALRESRVPRVPMGSSGVPMLPL